MVVFRLQAVESRIGGDAQQQVSRQDGAFGADGGKRSRWWVCISKDQANYTNPQRKQGRVGTAAPH